jgi:hypothetical protein
MKLGVPDEALPVGGHQTAAGCPQRLVAFYSSVQSLEYVEGLQALVTSDRLVRLPSNPKGIPRNRSQAVRGPRSWPKKPASRTAGAPVSGKCAGMPFREAPKLLRFPVHLLHAAGS